jgi:hypothetical protein
MGSVSIVAIVSFCLQRKSKRGAFRKHQFFFKKKVRDLFPFFEQVGK